MLSKELSAASDNLVEFGISPQISSYKTYSDDEWFSFCSLRDLNPDVLEGTYLPRTLSAHLKQETPFLQLNFLHEYFGHGTFCEHSQIGRRIVDYEHELAEIERQILGVEELPQNLSFKIDRTNPFFETYAELRGEFDAYFRKHHNYYEGFAYWLEHYPAKQCGLQGILEEKRQLIKHDYLNLVAAFDEFAGENGELALLEKLGFFQ